MIGIIKKISLQIQGLPQASPRGLSLIEVVVALSIFSVIMLIAADSFMNVIEVNRESAEHQSLQDHTRFLFEMMSKEIKMAQVINDETCQSLVGYNRVYKVEGTGKKLMFKNYHGECVTYSLEGEGLKITRKNNVGAERSALVVPADIKVLTVDSYFDITDLNFKQCDNSGKDCKEDNDCNGGNCVPSITNRPPSVSFFLHLQSNIFNPPDVELQSTVSARYLE